MEKVEYIGLTALAEAYSKITGEKLSLYEIAMLVRQIHIGHGCLNDCSHCFAVPPQTIQQMKIDSFEKLAGEFGAIIKNTSEEFPFLFLGASTDPSMIYQFSEYLKIWLSCLPEWHTIRFYTHGWLLTSSKQIDEYNGLCLVIRKYSRRIKTINFSLDQYSKFARENWDAYVENIAKNIMRLLEILPLDSLRLHVIYPVGSLNVSNILNLDFWRTNSKSNYNFPEEDIYNLLLSVRAYGIEKECIKLLLAIIRIGDLIGLKRRDIFSISRYGGVPIRSGRTKQIPIKDNEEESSAFKRYKENDLRPLLNFPKGLEGIIIMPDGKARIVDYLGYNHKEWLNNGEKVITFIDSFQRKDNPWS